MLSRQRRALDNKKSRIIPRHVLKIHTSRGADISFLSVYSSEQEALYPPLTYLRSVKTKTEDVGGKSMQVATVQPVFM